MEVCGWIWDGLGVVAGGVFGLGGGGGAEGGIVSYE